LRSVTIFCHTKSINTSHRTGRAYPHYDPSIQKESPLHLAAYFGQRDIVQSLLDKGADYRAINRDGRTAMGLAQEKGHTDIVGLFRKYARQSGDSSDIMTFFDYAAVKDTERIKSNISQGIDINARTHFGMTP
jgi:ankyrin repeat protein